MHWLVTMPLLLLCAAWVVTYVRLAINLVRFPALSEVEISPQADASTVSVVIAARDEAKHVEETVRTLLAVRHPRLEVIVVDDRSADGTADVVRSASGDDHRVKLLRVESLPDDWLGKPHALSLGLAAATGEWVLFSDADVRFGPESIGRAVSLATARGVDHLAVFPDLDGGTFWMRVAAGTFGAHLLAGLSLPALENPDRAHCVGVGAFNLVRRSVLDRTPGFDWLRMEIADDLGLAMMIKLAGGRAAAAGGLGHVRVPWYADVVDLVRGLEKNTFGAVGAYSLSLGVIWALLMVLFAVAPFATLLVAEPVGLRLAGLVAWLAAPACGLIGRRRFGIDVAPSFFTSFGLMILGWSVLRSSWRGWRRGGIEWRGTFYSLERLRRGRRVTLWGRTRQAG